MIKNSYRAYIGILPRSCLAEIVSTDITCPLGQLTLASYAKERIPDLEATVFDGEKTDDEQMLAKASEYSASGKKVLSGITLNAGNTLNAFNLAKRLDSMGIDVIIGGPEATQVGEDIFSCNERPYIKALITGAGERLLVNILKNGISQRTYQGDCELDFAGIKIDYDLLNDLKKYKGVTYLWGNDCQNAKRRCYFCGRISLGKGFRDPNIVWAELLGLYRRGFRYFYNNTDTVAVSVPQLRRFVEFKPREMTDDRHHVFINASQLTPEVILLLQRLNATVHIGIENPALYETVGKHGSHLGDNEQALRYLKDAQIPAILSFVVGMPGEDEQTLAQNRSYIKYITSQYGGIIQQILISPLMLTSGSRAYDDRMGNPKMAEKYQKKTPPFDVIEMSEDYFRLKTRITRRRALEWIKGIYQLGLGTNPSIKMDTKGITSEEFRFLTGL